ncbi:MAG: hypothetical protein ACEQSX_15135 [Baekduiaceae bacterium]
MEPMSVGALVNVATDGPVIDGIVFDRPSSSKVVVAVIDRTRGPVFRTVHPDALSERTTEGDADRALQLLIKRTAPAQRGAARGGAGVGRGHAGHTRAATHRTTGK